jgi:hypothetical protein
MTDYRKNPSARPWSRDLSLGDMLSAEQGYCLCHTRMEDFGLTTAPAFGTSLRVTQRAAYERWARKPQEFDTSPLPLFGDGHKQREMF